jgi:hypothetical protein
MLIQIGRGMPSDHKIAGCIFSLGLMGFSLVGIDQQSRDMKERQQDETV